MAFKGTLDSLGIVEVLQLICMSRKTGRLAVAHPSGEVRHLYFEGGDVTAAVSTAAKDRLGAVLVKMGLLSSADLELARRGEQRSGVKQGAALVEHGLITEEQLDQALARHVTEVFYSLMAWQQGAFEFFEAERPTADVFLVRQSVTTLLMQGTRQADEWHLIERTFASLDAIPSLVPQQATATPISLAADEWQILTFIDGRRSIREICAQSSQSNFEVCRKLLSLHRAGLIRTALPAGPRPEAPVRRVPPTFFPVLRDELTRHVGPIADVILQETADVFGLPLDTLPASRVGDLATALASEIDSPDKRAQFRETVLAAARG